MRPNDCYYVSYPGVLCYHSVSVGSTVALHLCLMTHDNCLCYFRVMEFKIQRMNDHTQFIIGCPYVILVSKMSLTLDLDNSKHIL